MRAADARHKYAARRVKAGGRRVVPQFAARLRALRRRPGRPMPIKKLTGEALCAYRARTSAFPLCCLPTRQSDEEVVAVEAKMTADL